MISTVYLHPERTLRATWTVDNGDATLVAFVENTQLAEPSDETSSEHDVTTTRTTTVLHSSKVLFHRYPVDAEEEHDRRRFFEIITCLPPLMPEDHIIDVPMSGLLHGSKWHGLLVIQQSETPEGMFPNALSVDILEDIKSARFAGFLADAGITMLIGRRGDIWWCAVLDAEGNTLHLVQSPVHEAFEESGEVRDLVLEVCGSMNIRVERVVLFGDTLTKSMLDDTTVTLQDLTSDVMRLNPFRTIRSNVDAATQQRCIRLAHLLGPLVGPLQTNVLQDQA